MRLNEIIFGEGRPVEGYGPGFFRVGGEVFGGNVLCWPAGAALWGGLEDVAPLLAAAGEIDVLLIGTGAEIAQIPGELRAALEGAGLGIELMATPSAARTYNVLLSEGRRIGAALLTI